MAVATVTLTGDAVEGLIPYAALPVVGMIEVKLGRNLPKFHKPIIAASQLMKYLRDVPIPASVDWYTKAAPSIARMYLNDRYGDCVFAGKAHNLGIWSYNDPDSGGGVLATDQEISQQYFDYTGGSDSGAVISEVYDLMVNPGFLAGGKRYKISSYIQCDWTSKELTQACIAVFGAGSIGINLPDAWTSEKVWDVTNTGIVGGHDVSQCGYGKSVVGTTADGVVISSWGRLYVITWAAWTSRRWLDECYFAVPEKLWTGDDKLAPSGATYAELLADLKLAEQGKNPPIPGPNPPPSPPPPPPIPVPPSPQVIHIPAIPVKIFGLTVGSTVPTDVMVTSTTVGDHAGWQEIVKLFGQLAVDIGSGLWEKVPADLLAIANALHLFGLTPKKYVGIGASTFGPVVPWYQVGMDVFALGLAIYRKDVVGVIAALEKLAQDFGLVLHS